MNVKLSHVGRPHSGQNVVQLIAKLQQDILLQVEAACNLTCSPPTSLSNEVIIYILEHIKVTIDLELSFVRCDLQYGLTSYSSAEWVDDLSYA